MVIAPTLMPLGVEAAARVAGRRGGVPICPGAVAARVRRRHLSIYRWLVGWQGEWLQAREQRILEIVTTKAE